jgi:DNA-binding transcriptional LysR family regulator
MQQAARAGHGLAYLSEWNVATDLQAGTLVRVLEGWSPPLDGLCLYYLGRRHVPTGLRALIDMIREHADSRRLLGERPSSKGRCAACGASAAGRAG